LFGRWKFSQPIEYQNSLLWELEIIHGDDRVSHTARKCFEIAKKEDPIPLSTSGKGSKCQWRLKD
jgi:hypothetical protein